MQGFEVVGAEAEGEKERVAARAFGGAEGEVGDWVYWVCSWGWSAGSSVVAVTAGVVLVGGFEDCAGALVGSVRPGWWWSCCWFCLWIL